MLLLCMLVSLACSLVELSPDVHHAQLLCRKIFEVNDWAWFPSQCSLETFDARKLAQKLAGRYVLMIGDSLMVQVTHIMPCTA